MKHFNKENKMTLTKQDRLIEAFEKGQELTAKQMTQRFGIANPTATVSDLRLRNGLAIYANKRTNKLGGTYTKYRLGTPSREVVAAGYKALSAGLV
jgi:Helix-turn-helix domain